MELSDIVAMAHPRRESKITASGSETLVPEGPLIVDTEGGRYQVQWDDTAPATPPDQFVFFAQFLRAGELFSRLCADASE
jgi:hypothetical protein